MKQMKKLVLISLTLIILSVLSTSFVLAASSPDENAALETAERLYANGDYELAAQTYQKLLDQGYADAMLYFNIGVAYHAAGDLNRALWSLQSAQEFAPRDVEIAAAIERVRAEFTAQNVANPTRDLRPTSDLVGRAAAATGSWLTANELAVLALLLWMTFAVLVLMLMVGRGPRRTRRFVRFGALLTGVLVIIAVIALSGRMQSYKQLAAGPTSPNSVILTASK